MRLRLVVLLACLALLVPAGFLLVRGDQDPPEKAVLTATTTRHSFTQFSSTADFAEGTLFGATNDRGWLRVGQPRSTMRIGGVSYDSNSWNSPRVRPGHTFTELIPSWRGLAPADTWLIVMARVRSTSGPWSTWKKMAQWRQPLGRTSFRSQSDAVASVSTDTIKARPGVSLDAYQLRVILLRKAGTTTTPVLTSAHAVASRIGAMPATSKPLYGARALDVPTYSQMTHRGEYPQYGGGGQAWCSPTSLSMVLAYFGKRPRPAEYSWVNRSYPDRWVAHTARQVFDHGYDGAGNWAFNTAYAGTRTAAAMVTRLRSLRDVERFIAKGIPVEVSISFGRGQLTGAPISATNGHLVVVTGFTRNGDVLVNDPAAPRNSSVKRTYQRGQFERAWQRKSHGLAYLVRGYGTSFPSGYVS
jgi:hypothetical protein